jgi:diaminopimelate epimerase
MKFWKYQGAGNDFVMLDQRQDQDVMRSDTAYIEKLCDRRFGIGADGLILLQNLDGYDFEMVYFNSDGRESSMCGNGGRCIAAFARDLGIIGNTCRFWAIDGEHEAKVSPTAIPNEAWVELKMTDVQNVLVQGNTYQLNTGSPHYVRFEDAVESLDMMAEGKAVRYSDAFKQEGINVNIVCDNPAKTRENGLFIRTYERGVEAETFACGTGVTAAAIATYFQKNYPPGAYEIPVEAKGGSLSVRFNAQAGGLFTDIWLCGPAAFVFEGNINSGSAK